MSNPFETFRPQGGEVSAEAVLINAVADRIVGINSRISAASRQLMRDEADPVLMLAQAEIHRSSVMATSLAVSAAMASRRENRPHIVSAGSIIEGAIDHVAPSLAKVHHNEQVEPRMRSFGHVLVTSLQAEPVRDPVDRYVTNSINRLLDVVDWAEANGQNPVHTMESDSLFNQTLAAAIDPARFADEELVGYVMPNPLIADTALEMAEIAMPGIKSELAEDPTEAQITDRILDDIIGATRVASKQAVLNYMRHVWGDDVLARVSPEAAADFAAAAATDPVDMVLYGRDTSSETRQLMAAEYQRICDRNGEDLANLSFDDAVDLRTDYEFDHS